MPNGKVANLIAGKNNPLTNYRANYFSYLGGCFVEDPKVNRANGATPWGSSWGIVWECFDDTPHKDLLAPGWNFCRHEPSSDELSSSEKETFNITDEENILNKLEAKFIWDKILKWNKKFSKLDALELIERILDLYKEQTGIKPYYAEHVKKYINRIAGHVTRRDMLMCLRKMEIC